MKRKCCFPPSLLYILPTEIFRGYTDSHRTIAQHSTFPQTYRYTCRKCRYLINMALTIRDALSMLSQTGKSVRARRELRVAPDNTCTAEKNETERLHPKRAMDRLATTYIAATCGYTAKYSIIRAVVGFSAVGIFQRCSNYIRSTRTFRGLDALAE